MENKDYKTKTVNFGDLVSGDRIIGSDGQPTTVTDVYEKHLPESMYEIEMEDGEVVQASGNHLWYCETNIDEKNKVEYMELAKEFFENYEIPEKLKEDELFPLKDFIQIFGKDIYTILFIEKACKSLGYSSYTPHFYYEDKIKKSSNREAILNYSYNDFIEFLTRMKHTLETEKGYFYFGEVRTTSEIFSLIKKGHEVNIPHKKDLFN